MNFQFSWEDMSKKIKPGDHAFIGASTYSRWWNHTPEEAGAIFRNLKAAERGTKLHAMAADDIRMCMGRPKNGQTYNRYVNDAIGYYMKPEVGLYFSPYAFGTADAISFDNGKLRIHDLKTGTVSKPSMHQLETYAAYFFMQYGTKFGFKPTDIDTELRLYWCDTVIKAKPKPADIQVVMNKISVVNSYIEQIAKDYE